MNLGIAGRRAAVAGASSGLGLATAKALAAEGARVVICGRRPERLETAAAEVGHGCQAFIHDVGSADGGEQFIEKASALLGGNVEILISNSGGPVPGDFAHTGT